MARHILPGTPPVAITLRRSARARRISLRISGLDGRITLTHPATVPEREALAFAHDKAEWLRGRLRTTPGLVPVGLGTEIPVEGVMLRLTSSSTGRINVQDQYLEVPGTPDTTGRRVQAWLRTRARDRLAAASDRHARQLQRPYSGLALRDTRSRWGSCSAQGRLMFSWRLIMAPPEVLDYVAAHEVAHLAEMNHSAAFWAVVARLMPDHAAPRRWLRDNGARLHRYRFGD